MAWNLHIAKSVAKKIKKFPPKDRNRIIIVIRSFTLGPYSGDIEKIKGEINTWRKRIGNFRILYEVGIKNKLILIRHIRRRTTTTY